MRKRQEKNIYIQPPRNILLQFFFLLTSKPRYQKNIQIFTSDGSRTRNLGFEYWKWYGQEKKVLGKLSKDFLHFFSFCIFGRGLNPCTWSDTNIYKNGNIFDFTSSKINFARSTYNFFSPKCIQICTYSSKRYASIFPNWYKNVLFSL